MLITRRWVELDESTSLTGELDRLRQSLERFASVVLCAPPSVLHFAAYGGSSFARQGSPPWGWAPAALVVQPDGAQLLVAEHERHQAVSGAPLEVLAYDPVHADGTERAFTSALAKLLETAPRPVGLELSWLPAQVLAESQFDANEFGDISAAVRRLTARKLPWEIERIADACALASIGQRAVAAALDAEVTELELLAAARAAMERQLRQPAGLVGEVVSGPTAERGGSSPPTTRALSPGKTAFCDLVPIVGGFFGDSCSTLIVGEIPAAARAAVEAAALALYTAARKIAPGVPASSIDHAARAVLQDAGFDCPHYIGHGVGHSQLDYPLIDSRSGDLLEAGHVVALEPAVYIPEIVACRLEHVYVVAEKGAVPLTDHSLIAEAVE